MSLHPSRLGHQVLEKRVSGGQKGTLPQATSTGQRRAFVPALEVSGQRTLPLRLPSKAGGQEITDTRPINVMKLN